MSGETVVGHARAWGWVAHLRSGGTEPWARWRSEGADGAAEAPGHRYLPGAQQLELLRRLNLAHAAGAPSPSSALVERVVTASAPGRGAPDLELAGCREESRFGPRPVDPVDLDAGELMRVTSSLLAEDVVAAAPPQRPRALRRPWARHYRLVGDPWVADTLRPQLVARGRPPGRRDPQILVLGADFPTMLAHAFTARAFDEGGPDWESWLAAPDDDRPHPPRADLLTMLSEWDDAPGEVRLVLDHAVVPRLVGLRRPLEPAQRLSAAACDLARWVGAPLGLLVLPDERVRLLRHVLLPRVRDDRGAPLGLPQTHHDWALRQSARVRDAVLAAGYPVTGDPARLAPGTIPAGTTPEDDDVLDLGLRLLLEGPGAGTGTGRATDEEDAR